MGIQKRLAGNTSVNVRFGSKADVWPVSAHVRLVPEADIGDCPGEDPKYRQKGAQAQTTQLLNLIASLVDGVAASREFAGRSREKS